MNADPPPTTRLYAARAVPRPAPPSRLHALTLPNLHRGQAALDLAFIVFVAIFISFVALLALPAILPADALAGTMGLTASKWLDAAAACGLAAFLCQRRRLPAKAFGVAPIAPLHAAGWTLFSTLSTFAALIASGLIVAPFIFTSPELEQETVAQRLEFAKALPADDLIQTLLLLAAVAIHEEILFRGLLLPYLRRVVGRWWLAVLISSAVFGSLHYMQGLLAMFQTALLGLALALCYLGARNIIPVILAHFAFNLIMFQLMAALPEIIKAYEQARDAADPNM